MNTFEKEKFRKISTLKNKILISRLFNSKNQIKSYPIILYFLECKSNEIFEDKVIFSIPKKSLKNAVDRNKIKRRIKESFKKILEISFNNNRKYPIIIGFVYIGKLNIKKISLRNKNNKILKKLDNYKTILIAVKKVLHKMESQRSN